MIMQYNPFFVRNPPSHHHAIHSFSFVIWVSKEKILEEIPIPTQKEAHSMSSFSWTAIERIVTNFYFHFLRSIPRESNERVEKSWNKEKIWMRSGMGAVPL